MFVCDEGAKVGADARGWDGDRMQIGDVTGNEAGEDANGETGSAMFDIICQVEDIFYKKFYIQTYYNSKSALTFKIEIKYYCDVVARWKKQCLISTVNFCGDLV